MSLWSAQTCKWMFITLYSALLQEFRTASTAASWSWNALCSGCDPWKSFPPSTWAAGAPERTWRIISHSGKLRSRMDPVVGTVTENDSTTGQPEDQTIKRYFWNVGTMSADVPDVCTVDFTQGVHIWINYCSVLMWFTRISFLHFSSGESLYEIKSILENVFNDSELLRS